LESAAAKAGWEDPEKRCIGYNDTTMHLRFSTCIGLPILAEDSDELIGTIAGILIHPDRSTVEGFFVRRPGLFSSATLFLSSMDIARFGRRIIVRDVDRVAPAQEFLRVQPLLADPRTVLNQRIRTESSHNLGRCDDVQFENTTMRLTWIFPRKFFHWGFPISARQILEVRPQAIIVRDPQAPAVERVLQQSERRLAPLLPEVPEGV